MDVIVDCTVDGFLDGRIIAAQPKAGFRAGHDTVLLAAAVPAGRKVLELGSGAGIASLCYARRVADAEVLGVEIDPDLVAIAIDNAARNGLSERARFLAGDARALADAASEFDQVFFNPPFHSPEGTASANPALDRAKRDLDSNITAWTKSALGAVCRSGRVTAMLRADRVQDMITAAANHTVTLFPLIPRRGVAPKRVIVSVIAGEAGPVKTRAGLVLHRTDGEATPEADAILRGGCSLPLG